MGKRCPGTCQVLFTADLDLVKGGPWYAGQNSSIYQTIRSLERLKTFPAETYLTSHGRGIYHGDPNLIDKYLNVIFERENLIIESLKKSSKTMGTGASLSTSNLLLFHANAKKTA